jgi:hypothetical protein
MPEKILEAPIHADPTPMTADDPAMVASREVPAVFQSLHARSFSAAIGVGSAFIGAFKALRLQ